MAKINILDSNVYNRIAAGEVVERPASAVKEFVENSLDARAKNIVIRIERGGKDLISVSDDGAGIEKSEMYSAFLPHATSKIEKAEDLDAITTLGFRGEALASIASVSRVTLRSKTAGEESAGELVCAGGKMGEILPCALSGGTEIVAENLFYNTPVRAKFMKTDKGEESEVSAVVSRFVLGNPEVAFKYYIDGKLSLQSFGGGLDEAVAAVYGASVIAECYQIDAVKHGIRLRGYLGKPTFTKANRTYQSVFVNGRYVVNNTISSAISNAYASYLMKRQYPFYVLFVDVPPEIVDVNVHPNKSDVRFENNQIIYGSIYSVVSAVLDGNASAIEYVVGGTDEAEKEKSAEHPSNGALPSFDSGKITADRKFDPGLSAEDLRKGEKEERAFASPTYTMPKRQTPVMIEFHDSAAGSDPFKPEKADLQKAEENFSEDLQKTTDIFEENKRYLDALEKKAKQQKLIFDSAEYKGCLFNTYLIYEAGDDAYIIDQHAAHERLIFDRLRAEMEERRIVRQPMLVPYIVNANHAEAQFLSDNLTNIEGIGFEIEEFGAGSFKISSVPLDLQDIDLDSFFRDLLGEIGNLKGIKLSELLRDKIAMTACKHAVKGGMSLTDSEKEKLFEMLRGDMGLKCPHGRPIAVKLSKYEIEKMFKRIV